ncbi:hypothetical protein QNO07_04475 [Streptomyces sp. 549]|uniref:hypothetical protein n=1 Tax=Streptomyces sp. 549 TaxID=3049076 RepID=UPI0024C2D739|nr:hypothetical protein [Streptomyces sp. 549]MDK1472687.1 hypothetical protein [Streptomyces sp. 549]
MTLPVRPVAALIGALAVLAVIGAFQVNAWLTVPAVIGFSVVVHRQQRRSGGSAFLHRTERWAILAAVVIAGTVTLLASA